MTRRWKQVRSRSTASLDCLLSKWSDSRSALPTNSHTSPTSPIMSVGNDEAKHCWLTSGPPLMRGLDIHQNISFSVTKGESASWLWIFDIFVLIFINNCYGIGNNVWKFQVSTMKIGCTWSTLHFLLIIQKNVKCTTAWPILKSNVTLFWFKGIVLW